MQMEIYTGAAVTVISQENTANNKEVAISYWTTLELSGQATVNTSVEGVTKDLILFIAKGNCPSLFG